MHRLVARMSYPQTGPTTGITCTRCRLRTFSRSRQRWEEPSILKPDLAEAGGWRAWYAGWTGGLLGRGHHNDNNLTMAWHRPRNARCTNDDGNTMDFDVQR